MSTTKVVYNPNPKMILHNKIVNGDHHYNGVNTNNNTNNHKSNTNQQFGAENVNKRTQSGEYNYFRFNHNRLPYVVGNEGKVAEMEMLPMPPQEGFFYDINTYDKYDFDEPEPRWNPDIHLRVTEPEYIVRMDNWEKVKSMEPVKGRKDGTTDSKLGFTAPFGLLSPEAVEIVKKICYRELGTRTEVPNPRGNKRAVRGFWYTSPFIRDMMSCPRHLAILEKLTGEPVVPYFSYSNSPQINISKLGNKGTIDHWHHDSLSYVSVLMLSDMTQVTGGALEVMKCDRFEGLDKLEKKEPLEDFTYTVNYERPGMCILNHGSEVLHHVTPITYNPKNIVRMSVIMAFGSRNAYRPNELCLHTMTFCDSHSNAYGYEYFRSSAWQMMTILKDMAENEKYSEDNQKFANYFRQIADELTRAAHQLENPNADKIKFYHEENQGCTSNHHERSKELWNIATNFKAIKKAIQDSEEKGARRQ